MHHHNIIGTGVTHVSTSNQRRISESESREHRNRATHAPCSELGAPLEIRHGKFASGQSQLWEYNRVK